MTNQKALTKNQDLVLTCLQAAPAPMSAYDILGQLKQAGIKAPLQVYRALDKLVSVGMAHRLESLNAFVACADEHCHRKGMVAFAICSICGGVEEFADTVLKDQLEKHARISGFAAEKSIVELRGKCADCIAAN